MDVSGVKNWEEGVRKESRLMECRKEVDELQAWQEVLENTEDRGCCGGRDACVRACVRVEMNLASSATLLAFLPLYGSM
jgi:hypothetical protein